MLHRRQGRKHRKCDFDREVAMSTEEPVATRLEVTSRLPSPITGGVPFDVTVTAEDNQGNVVPSFD